MNVKVEEPGQNNVHNNAFYAEEKLLKSELEAMRDCDSLSARHWIVRAILFSHKLLILMIFYVDSMTCSYQPVLYII